MIYLGRRRGVRVVGHSYSYVLCPRLLASYKTAAAIIRVFRNQEASRQYSTSAVRTARTCRNEMWLFVRAGVQLS